MRTAFSILAALAALLAPAVGAPNALTAMQAVKLLPKDAWPRLARVEAFEGAPIPERWHILVHDTREENGLHEYVIANGEVVASRAVSQFAEELKADDIIGSEAIKFDSDRAASLAKAYAEASKLTFASCNYELKKEAGESATPLWKVTCLDAKGDEIGAILISASKGTVVKREGFTADPVLYQGMTREEFAAADAKWEREKALRAAKKPAGPPRVMRAEPPPEQPRGFFGRIFGGGR